MSSYVVGVDGSAPSKAALEWALERSESRRRHPLRLVHVLDDEAGLAGPDIQLQAEREGRRLLAERLEEARQLYPDLELSSTVLHGSMPWELSHAAGPPDMLVLGTHRSSSSDGRVLGSRSVQVASITPATLAVIPDRRRNPAGPVVVGVGMREPAGPAVVWAAHEAAATKLPLLLVHGMGSAERRAGAPHPELAAINLSEAKKLALEIEPGATVSTRLSPDGAAQALLAAAYEASTLVVGPSRTFGTGASPIGTVTQSVLLNTHCPVLVTRYSAGA
ncbi:universal stress protein [Lysobacter korlensis]|uniref:Universal stress protein n=1 Tax=Lysobacter korlensis TaxID=553636 RepID=A0ABV6RP02_9GAMM